jgi:UDP-2,3-diacylglucosamine pyrophosphatase LpxH
MKQKSETRAYPPQGEIRDRSGFSYRALFVSDIHLGTRACQADRFLEFLKHYDAETIFLVGDIIDFWRLKRGPVWPQAHNDIVQKVLRKVRKGARLIYIPGNHDEALRDYCGMHFGGIEFHHDFIHVTASGERLLVMHGDEFDVVVRYAKWLAFLGDRSYEFALWCNHPLNWIRRKLGFGYWSLSAYLKKRVKAAVNFIGEFEEALAAEAARRSADGVVCGHIHHATKRKIGDTQYINCGDWVESCSAIVEDYSGQLHIVQWQEAAETILTPMKPDEIDQQPVTKLRALPSSSLDPSDPESSSSETNETLPPACCVSSNGASYTASAHTKNGETLA